MRSYDKSKVFQDENAKNLPEVYGYIPPRFTHEGAILGICLVEPETCQKIANLVKSFMFYEDRHQRIFKAIENLLAKNGNIDYITVFTEVETQKDGEKVGGLYYLTQLTNGVVSSAHIKDWCQILVQKYLSREVIKLSRNLTQQAYSEDVPINTLIESAGNAYNFLLSNVIHSDSKHIGDIFFNRLQSMESGPRKEGLSGVPTGYHDVDALTAGWQEGDLVIIAARPSMGKTALAAQLCYRPAKMYKVPSLFISLEMTNEKIADRLIASECMIYQGDIQRNNLKRDQLNTIGDYISKNDTVPMYMNDESRNLSDICATIRMMVEKHGVKIVFIDYLQLIESGEERTFGQNRDQQLGKITGTLKGLAKQLRITIFPLSQLSRKVEERTTKRPMLGDLRESGNIEQDADLVFMLYRAWYYIEREGNGMVDISMKVDAELICAKNRNGALDTIHLRFLSQYAGFFDFRDDYLDFSEVPSGPPDPYSPHRPLPFPGRPDQEGF